MGREGQVRKRKWLVAVLLFSLGLTAAAGAFVRWPLWCALQLTRARLTLAGIHGQTVPLGGLEVHYLAGGAGSPVVFVHGLGGQALDWHQAMRAAKSAGHRVYALDLPGFGETSGPEDRTYSVREQAKLVESFLEAEHLGAVTLVGESMGGWISALVALERPEHVSQLVLMDSPGLAFPLQFDPSLFTPETPAEADQLMARMVPRPEPVPGFLKEDLLRHVKRRSWVIRRAVASMLKGDDLLDQRFSSLKLPLLLVWGREDAVVPLAVGEAMHRAAPQSVLEVYAGCGHIALNTCSEKVLSRFLAFLAGNGPAPGTTVEVPE